MRCRPVRAFLVALVLGVLPAAQAAGPASSKETRPNVLLLFSDDQRADTIAAHGNPHIQTPNLDRLAGRGLSFRRSYCFGGNSGAVCVPSRAMLMSGRTWFRVDHQMSNARILPEVLRQNGYRTFITGKWHNQPPALLRGFEQGKAVFLGGMCDHTKVPLRDITAGGALGPVRTGEKFSSELFADAAVEFLKGQTRDKPFFAYVAFTAPHDPRQPPEKYRDMYYRRRPPLPRNYLPQHPFDNGQLILRDENLAPWPRPKEVISDQLCEYYGMITHLDEQIGRVLAALEQTGQADRTFIVFASDHGLAMGSHGLLGKQNIYEDAMRCPLILAGPGIPKGKESRAFTYLYDIHPTVCSLVGVKPAEGVEGENLRPLWEGGKEQVRSSVFLPYQQLQRSVRNERWKLICYPKIGHMQLFDLEKDPDEVHSLIDEPGHQKQASELLALMKEWQARVGDKLPLPEKSQPAGKVDLTGTKRKPDQWQPEWIRAKYFGER